jgi:hypothetical protein
MKTSAKIAISLLSLAALPFINGCSSKTEDVSKTTTAYVPAPSQETVVVQPAPAPVVVPAPSTVTTTEERSRSNSNSNSSDMGNNATRESSSAYHSESSTVTPMTAPPQGETTTTYEKKTYQGTN